MQENNILYRHTHDAYSLMLISLILGFLTLPPALILILYHLRAARGSYLRSHLLYLLGNLVQLPVCLALIMLAWRWTMAQNFVHGQGNIFPPLIIYPTLVILPVAWWIWRFVQGYRLLKMQQGIKQPFTPGRISAAAQDQMQNAAQARGG